VTDEEIQQAWERELLERIQDIVSGKVQCLPAHEVEADIEAALEQNRVNKGH